MTMTPQDEYREREALRAMAADYQRRWQAASTEAEAQALAEAHALLEAMVAVDAVMARVKPCP
jgi:hypothetical protein